MSNIDQYEIVIGLEVHVRLQTASKLFCGDSIAFGAPPNTHISPITLGHPGTLPKMNRLAVEYAIRMGLACHCEIERYNYFARKNYFYPDLPKGYQVSQHTTPICKEGFVIVKTSLGEKKIRLSRIHLEEDAGKSLHDADETYTSIDYNRAGTPLIEIVTEPDLRSAEEAFAYVSEIRKLVRYLGISDGNMEEGSLRCDANISVRKKGDPKLGTRVEVKNLNSIRNIKRAVETEAERLIELVENGQPVIQQTRSFDANTGTTFAIRDKEDADDYRYFPEPDLTPFQLQDEFIERIRQSIPALPEQRIATYITEFGLPVYDATVLTEEKETADYFEQLTALLFSATTENNSAKAKAAANWMLGPVKTWLNEQAAGIPEFPITPERLASMIELVESGKISFSAASAKLFPLLLSANEKTALELAEENNLLQESDVSAIEPIIDQILQKFAGKVEEYRKGKKGLLALFVGEVMKQSKGKADPKRTNELLLEKLNTK
ncbi:MAG: Asp-tRNA(Asn)/Glu-tRNA(Gln) amidotransferase subunit GatB [Bacteroidetes bacterium]|nr:Asp-tRNA(Asn)/Glu-tRNA(Gln) amidotransferase subunit GatB [Bacteroidota bacterium]